MDELISKIQWYGKVFREISEGDYNYYKMNSKTINPPKNTTVSAKFMFAVPILTILIILLATITEEAPFVIFPFTAVFLLSILPMQKYFRKNYAHFITAFFIGIGVAIVNFLSLGLSVMITEEVLGLRQGAYFQFIGPYTLISFIIMRLIIQLFIRNKGKVRVDKHLEEISSPDLIQLCDLGENIYHGFRQCHTGDGRWSFASWENVEKIDQYELASKIQIPVLTELKDYNSREHYLSLINSDKSRQILKSSAIIDYLTCTDNTFKIDNSKKEEYVLHVQSLLGLLPAFPFNIQDAGGISKPLHFGSEAYKEHGKEFDYNLEGYKRHYVFDADTPNFTRAATDLTSQPPFKELVKMHSAYSKNLKDFYADAKGTIIGAEGERAVLEEFDFYSKQWRVLSNIRLEVNGQSVESDIIAVTPYGVFAIEVKNLGSTGSYNITIEKDGLWKKVMKNGRWKPMGSVSKQNTRHLHGIEQIVNTQLNHSYDNWITTNSIIVFANDVVRIRNYSDNVIVRASEMVAEIRKHPICLNETQINQIADILQKSSLEAKKYEMQNWGKDILQAHLEIYTRAAALLPQIKPMLDLAAALANISAYPLCPTDFSISGEPEFTLEDNSDEYHKSAEELAQEESSDYNSEQDYSAPTHYNDSYQSYSDDNEGNHMSYNDLVNDVYGMAGNPMDIMNPYNHHDVDMPWVDKH